MTRRLRRISIVVLIAIGFERIYHDTIAGLIAEWLSSPEASYGLVLAATALVVACRRGPQFLAASSDQGRAAWGLGVSVAGAALFIVGQFGADVFLTRVSFVVLLAGAIWTLAGDRSFRIVAAPLFFLLIAIPLPALVINQLTLPLQLAASRIAESMLGLASIPVYRDGNLLLLPSATLAVAEACSGLRSAVSLGGVGMLLAWATEPSWPRRAAIVAATLPIAIFMNSLRVTATGIATEALGQPPSSEWHSFMGWVTFALSVAVLVAAQRIGSVPGDEAVPAPTLAGGSV